MSVKERILSIQAARGIAALMVVLYHCYIIIKQPQYGAVEVFKDFSELGILGVNFFFVLSGFIILMAHKSDIGVLSSAPSYLTKRIVRVYPIYWLALSAYIFAGYLNLGHPDFSWDFGSMFNAYALVSVFEQTGSLPLKVAWTLFYEIQFYFLFVAFLIGLRFGLAVFTVWTLSIVLDVAGVFSLGAITSSWNLHFIFGMFAYLAYGKYKGRYWQISLAFGFALIFLFAYVQYSDENNIKATRSFMMPLLALAFSLIVFGIASAEKSLRLTMSQFMIVLGNASYSIYLVHSAAISLAIIICMKIGLDKLIGWTSMYLVLAVLSSFAGVCFYYIFEKPILTYLRRFT